MREYVTRLFGAVLNREIDAKTLTKQIYSREKHVHRDVKVHQREMRNLLQRYERAEDKAKFVIKQRDEIATMLRKSYDLLDKVNTFNGKTYKSLEKLADQLEKTLDKKVPTW